MAPVIGQPIDDDSGVITLLRLDFGCHFRISSGDHSPSGAGHVQFIRLGVPILLISVLLGCGSAEPESASDTPPPSGTDIWLYDLSGDRVELHARVTNRTGYDNQPMFTPDSDGILFTSDREGRAHTFSYDLASGALAQLSSTDADKYSPTPIPGSDGVEYSVVHTDSMAFQGLWRYAVDGSVEPAPLVDVDAVAYYTWAGEGNVLFWRLGEPNTLQLIDTTSADTTVLAEGSVYSLHPIPGERASAYSFFTPDDSLGSIMRFDWDTLSSTRLTGANGHQHFALTPTGDLLVMSDGQLLSLSPGASMPWTVKADLGLTGGSRLAVSPDGNWLAVVAEARSR